MPTYEYSCDGCGHRFERFQKITQKPVRKCPSCEKSKARRLISAGGLLIFKGSGFYVTEHKRGGSSSDGSADGDKKKTARKTTRRTAKTDSGGQA